MSDTQTQHKRGQPPNCHLERKHYAKGLCVSCYAKQPHIRATHNAWKTLNKDKVVAGWKKLQAKRRGSGSHRKAMLKRCYGLTLEQYEKLYKQQQGLCAICNKPWLKRSLAVDHCHTTNKIRGLLCGRCNGQLGWLENLAWRSAAEEYLKKWA